MTAPQALARAFVLDWGWLRQWAADMIANYPLNNAAE